MVVIIKTLLISKNRSNFNNKFNHLCFGDSELFHTDVSIELWRNASISSQIVPVVTYNLRWVNRVSIWISIKLYIKTGIKGRIIMLQGPVKIINDQ